MATARTVRQLIDGALRLIGVYGVGEATSAADTSTALLVLQDLLAEHAGDISVPIYVQEAITLVAAQASYTVGENGSPDLNTQRPERIEGAWMRDSNNQDYPVDIIGERSYREISSKTTQARPNQLWYHPTVPNGTIYVYPVPSSVESLYISSIKTLSEPSTLTENLSNTTGLARNYHNPFRWLLALELCEEYGMAPTPLMLKRATEGAAAIKSLNLARNIEPSHLEVGESNQASRSRGSVLSYE